LVETAEPADGPAELKLSSQLNKCVQWMSAASINKVAFGIMSCQANTGEPNNSRGKDKSQEWAADKDGARILFGIA
jgi:hypothetical protein